MGVDGGRNSVRLTDEVPVRPWVGPRHITPLQLPPKCAQFEDETRVVTRLVYGSNTVYDARLPRNPCTTPCLFDSPNGSQCVSYSLSRSFRTPGSELDFYGTEDVRNFIHPSSPSRRCRDSSMETGPLVHPLRVARGHVPPRREFGGGR